jgi:hypothetical protein
MDHSVAWLPDLSLDYENKPVMMEVCHNIEQSGRRFV